jgi:hypothetical protein
LAEQVPVLIELVAKLQFPELPAWEELAAAYSYAAPPRLLLKAAEGLNRAYSEYEVLAPLVKQHRRLALTRAPLAERLALLRQLAQMDSITTAWQDDLVLYEEARQRQLRTEIDEALSRQEDAKVRTFLRELIETPWRAQLSQEFLRPIVEKYLEVLARGLDSCQRRNDIMLARQLLDEWSRVLAVSGVSPRGSVLRRVEGAKLMIERNDQRNIRELQFQSALSDLTTGIANGCTHEQLEELYEAVEKLDYPIPKSVAYAYHAHRQMLTKNRKRMEKIILISTFLGGLLILALFVAFLIRR